MSYPSTTNCKAPTPWNAKRNRFSSSCSSRPNDLQMVPNWSGLSLYACPPSILSPVPAPNTTSSVYRASSTWAQSTPMRLPISATIFSAQCSPVSFLGIFSSHRSEPPPIRTQYFIRVPRLSAVSSVSGIVTTS